MKEAKSRIFRRSRALTMYVSIPADIVKDSSFPFDRKGDDVLITVEGKCIAIKKSEG